MKHYLTHLFKTPMFLVFLLIVFVYGFAALGRPAEINNYAVVTAIGIDIGEESANSGTNSTISNQNDNTESSSSQNDKASSNSQMSSQTNEEDLEENKFEISLLTFIPIAEESFKENYRVITSQGRNIAEAIDFAGLHIGRQIELSHVKLVVINNKLLQHDISNYLDYLARSQAVTSSTKFITTDSSAKDFLSAAQKLDSQSSIKISDIVIFNQDYIYSIDSSFETFFTGLLGPTKVSMVPFLQLESSGENGFMVSTAPESSSQQNGPSSGSEASNSTGQDIVNNGDTYVLKNGVEKVLLSGKDMKKINFLNGNFKTGSIEVKNVTDDVFKNAKLTFEILDKELKFKVVYQNNVPVVFAHLELELKLSEVENEEKMIEENIGFSTVSNTVLEAVEKKVRTSMSQAIEIMRDNEIDIPNFYAKMHNTDISAFKKFMNSLDDKDNYLSHVVFKAGVKVSMK